MSWLPDVAQSYGDLAARQGVWRQDLVELQVTALLATFDAGHLRDMGHDCCICSLWAVPWPCALLLPAW